MAKLRGSITSKLIAVRDTLTLAIVSAQDHADLIKKVLAVIETIDKQLKIKSPNQ